MGSNQFLYLLQHSLTVSAVDHRGESGQHAGGIRNGDACPGVAIVNGHHSHTDPFPFIAFIAVSLPPHCGPHLVRQANFPAVRSSTIIKDKIVLDKLLTLC